MGGVSHYKVADEPEAEEADEEPADCGRGQRRSAEGAWHIPLSTVASQ
jgi:hypothetical protein